MFVFSPDVIGNPQDYFVSSLSLVCTGAGTMLPENANCSAPKDMENHSRLYDNRLSKV